jgi:hypothetical protein
MEFGIDFDEASNCWKENKKSKGNGMYVYKCNQLTKDGKPCCREAMKVVGAEYCKQHCNGVNLTYLQKN